MSETPVDYKLLAAFVAVAEHASFTRAAKALGVGKATVSRAVAELERIVGAELLHRTTHAVALSTAGTALYERTAPHLKALDQALRRLPERASRPSGVLRLTAPHDFGAIVLPHLLTRFTLHYPEVQVDARITNARVDLVADGFDLAIRAAGETLADSSLIARRLGKSDTCFYAAPSYLARRGRPSALADPDHDWLIHPAMAELFDMPRDLPWRMRCDDLLLLREVARDGGGIALLPRFVASPAVEEGTLERVRCATPKEHTKGTTDGRARASFFLVYPSSGQVSRKVAAFRDFAVAWIAEHPL